ncbi:RsmB/NOP family class I SAM-dependent RNA methyltransferase [Inhella gelatinilytica]|uniref:RsmB/NOP family class I SAM-dependent RNA methyltransferase n=1 Tax=Inhella gelatinilytica TaxID=2795030 RepID=A0A931IZ49_9BURK|nr:RsmB/NOP family class I SAM-dependent RNA methyltransferase [Inhella gelatinilytica]MBH9553769.1 RsmB/NOP family class I SAM-dependent RNA methyltransferase [Inhella gelatinilytica]
MHPKALMTLCTGLLQRVLTFDHPADRVVSAFFQENRALGSRERGALAETTYALLRQRLLFQNLAQSGKGPMERRLALLAWRGEPRTLEAALEDGEREWLARCASVDRSSLPAKLRHNLPDWLADGLKSQLGEAEFEDLAASLLEPAPLDLRVNTLTTKRESVLAELAEFGAVPTPFSPWGLRLQGKPNINHWPLFKNGSLEVQDEGSQLLALLLDAKRGEMVADFCAGAGGKTLALGAAMRNTGRLYAFDISGHRLDALRPRLARSGLSNVYPIQIAHERDERVKRLRGKLDRVLVDAPCSGLGTLRRNPDMKWRQSPQTVAALVPQQQAILASAAKLLKPGGRLVYATCSLLTAENEGVAATFEAANPDFERLNPVELLQANVSRAAELVTGQALRLWPHRHACDGFFAVAWQKR